MKWKNRSMKWTKKPLLPGFSDSNLFIPLDMHCLTGRLQPLLFMRPLKNAQFCSSLGNAIILTLPITIGTARNTLEKPDLIIFSKTKAKATISLFFKIHQKLIYSIIAPRVQGQMTWNFGYLYRILCSIIWNKKINARKCPLGARIKHII